MPDPIDMQRAMCPRSIPAVNPIILSPRNQKPATNQSHRMRYSFLKGQNTHFLSSDTMNDIAASHMRKATGGAAVVDEPELKAEAAAVASHERRVCGYVLPVDQLGHGCSRFGGGRVAVVECFVGALEGRERVLR